MKNIIKIIKEEKKIHYILLALIGLFVSIPLIWIQLRETHDGFLHLIRLIGLDKSIGNTAFPYLVAPYLCRDFGYSMLAFYPQIVTYIPYLFGIISQSFTNGLKIYAALTIVLSGTFMYNFINEVTKNKGISFIAAVVYMVFPYHYETIFFRFAIGEFTALIFIPIVFQGLYNLLHGDRKKHFYITIGAAGLLLSHSISTVYTAAFCIIYILFNLKKFFNKEVIKKCIINVLFIVFISLMFLVPMLEFKTQTVYSIFVPDVMKTSGEYTQSKGIQFSQLIKDAEADGVSFLVGIPIITMLLLMVLAYSKINKKYKDFYLTSFILGLLSLFMCTKYFPWYYMPDIFNIIQYPWRMLGFAFFFWALVCAMNIYYLVQICKKEWIRNTLFILVLSILIISTGIRFQRYKVEEKQLDKKYETEIVQNPEISHFSINRDYLPYRALKKQYTYLLEREDRVYVLSGNATIHNEHKQGLELSFYVDNVNEKTILELPYYFYPGYTVTLRQGDKIENLNTYESENGFIAVDLKENTNNGYILVQYTATKVEKLAYIISFTSLGLFILYVWYEYRKGIKNEK